MSRTGCPSSEAATTGTPRTDTASSPILTSWHSPRAELAADIMTSEARAAVRRGLAEQPRAPYPYDGFMLFLLPSAAPGRSVSRTVLLRTLADYRTGFHMCSSRPLAASTKSQSLVRRVNRCRSLRPNFKDRRGLYLIADTQILLRERGSGGLSINLLRRLPALS